MSRTDTAIRVISAPPDRVYAALTDSDALAVWLPPDGMTGRFEHFDARPGGSYRLVLIYADASAARGKFAADSDVVDARFVEIVLGVRVVQQIEFVSEDPAFHGTMTMTWEVTAVNAGSRVDIRAEDVPDGINAGELGSPHRPKKARCGRDSASDIRRPADVSPDRGAHGWGMKVNGIEKSTPVDRPVWLEQPDAHDQWNFMARRETPTQRLDRNYAEILQEVRVSQTGVQLLLAFLLTVAFTPRFATLTEFERGVYVGALVLGAAANTLLIAPAAFHRLVFQRRLKRQLVLASSRFALFGLVLLMLSINSALLLILSVTVGPEVAIWITAGALGWYALWWYAVPLWSRVKHSGSHPL